MDTQSRDWARRFNEWLKGTMVEAHGTRHLFVGDGHARLQLEWKPELSQPAGMFHAGAILALADEAATSVAAWAIDPEGNFSIERFPLSFQLSANLIRNVARGAITADAELVHRGRTTVVADVKVTDDAGRLLAKVSVTLMVPKAATTG